MFFLISPLWLALAQELDCPSSLCPSYYIGDGVCDTGCMLPSCNYDSALSEGSDQEKMESSDCYTACTTLCPFFFLNNDFCDTSCNNEVCAWDLGDCGYCASDCFESDLSSSAPECKEACKTIGCRFGQNKCGWCAEDCFYGMNTNSNCDPACLTSACDYDNDQCELCAPGCDWSMVGNGTCDVACANEPCNYDENDCLCGDNCTYLERTTVNMCLDKCNTEDCQWQNGVCGDCSANCFNNMLGNGYCDEACFTEACNFDDEDCFDIANCQASDRKCLDLCMLPDCCTYNADCQCENNSCREEVKRYMAVVHHVLQNDFTVVYDFDVECNSTDCSIEDMESAFDGTCDVGKCHDESCLYGLGACSDQSFCGGNCLRCANNDQKTCFECDNTAQNYILEYGRCVEACSIGYHEMELCLKDGTCDDDEFFYLCVPMSEDSSLENPQIIIVDPDYVSNRRLTTEETYVDLAEALQNTWKTYTTIKLRGNAHDIEGDLVSGSSGDQRLEGVNLVIQSECTACTGNERPSLFIKSPETKFPRSLSSLTLSNVILDGSLAINNTCTEKTCRYCPYTTTLTSSSAGTQYFDDRNQEIEDPGAYNVGLCPPSDVTTLIVAEEFDVTIENCEFKELRYEAANYIAVKKANLTIKNTDFFNVGVGDSEVSAIVFHEADESSSAAVFTMEGGYVSYVNNGYEYITGMMQYPFLRLKELKRASIKNTIFQYNTMLCDITHLCEGFIKAENVVFLTINSCEFKNNILISSIIEFNQSQIEFNTFELDSDGNCSECNETNLEISDNLFIDSGAVDHFIKIIVSEQSSIIEVKNNTFTGIISFMNIFSLFSAQTISSTSINGGQEIYTINGQKVPVINDPKIISIESNSFHSVIGEYFIHASSVANLVVRAFNVSKISNLNDINSITSKYKEGDHEYLENDLTLNTDSSFSSLMYCDVTTNIEIDYLSFNDLECEYTPCIMQFIDISDRIILKNMTLSSADFSGESVGLIQIGGKADNTLSVEDINCSDINYTLGTSLISISSIETVNLSRIYMNNVKSGNLGAIEISGASYVALSSVEMHAVESVLGSGGAITIEITEVEDDHSIEITDSIFESCSSPVRAGAIYITSSGGSRRIHLTVTGSTFSKNSSVLASILFISDSVSLTETSEISNCTFTENTVSTSGGIMTSHIQGLLTIYDCEFSGNSGRGSSVLGSFSNTGTLIRLDTVKFLGNSGNGAVYITSSLSSSELETENCVFEGNTDVAVAIVTGSWRDTSSSFQDNEVVLSLQISSFGYFTGTNFTDNHADGIGSVCTISSISSFSCTSCYFLKNTSNGNGGALTVESSSTVDLDYCTFEQSYSDGKGGAISFNNNLSASRVKNTNFVSNNAGSGGTINVVEALVNFEFVKFTSNSSSKLSSGILSNSGIISIVDSDFSGQSGVIGTYIFATTASEISITRTSMSTGSATEGGMITINSSSLTMNKSQIQDCSSDINSAAIYLYSNSEGSIVECTFTNNSVNDNSGHIHVENSEITIEHSVFTTMPNGGLTLYSVANFILTNTTFTDGASEQGAAILGDDMNNVAITDCSFTGLTSSGAGGAIYLSSELNIAGNYIRSSSFSSNSASEGGAIYFDNFSGNITSCTFLENSATDSGGAIFSTCAVSGDCSVNVTSNIFTQNTASKNGGAVAWSVKKPLLSSNTNISNSALYGPDVASFPIEIAQYSIYSSRILEDSSLASGQLVSPPIILALFDHYKQIVTTADGYPAQAFVTGEQASIAGTTQVEAESGVYNFSDLYVTAEAGTYPSLSFSSSELDQISSIDSDQPKVSNVSIEFYSRICQAGEYYFNFQCVLCSFGMYSLSPDQACEDCPSGAECYGGSDMAPIGGYWRKNNNTDVFYKCYNPDACLGGAMNSSGVFVPEGVCADGYRGNLCQPCDNGYSVTAKYNCGECLSRGLNILRLIGFGMLVIIVCAIMIRSSLRSAYQPKALHSVYIKIFVNYLQLVMLTAQFRLEWPDEVLELLQFQEQSGQATDQFFSFDCFLETDDEDSYKNVYFLKLIFMAVLPIFLAVAALGFWWAISYVRKDKSVLKQELVTTLCVVFFLIHPTVTRLMFSMFSCIEIEGENWLTENLDIKCWDEEHTYNSLMIGVPSIIIWVIGVPGIILLILSKRKKLLKKTSEKLRFGFLYNGYRHSTFYWEFVILYRKIVIICCAVFLNTISIPIQALVTFSVLMLCLHLQYTVKPFNRKELNQMEVRAIIVATITIYCGLYYLTEDLSATGKYIFLAVIIGANVYFFVFWLYYMCHAGLIIVSRFVPFLKDKIREAEVVERPVLSLLDSNDGPTKEELGEMLEIESRTDFFVKIMQNRLNKDESEESETEY